MLPNRRDPSSNYMTAQESFIIRRFAAGERELRDEAIEAHRTFLKRITAAPFDQRPKCVSEWPMSQQFMSEVDNPCPCHVLKAQYRKKLIGGM